MTEAGETRSVQHLYYRPGRPAVLGRQACSFAGIHRPLWLSSSQEWFVEKRPAGRVSSLQITPQCGERRTCIRRFDSFWELFQSKKTFSCNLEMFIFSFFTWEQKPNNSRLRRSARKRMGTWVLMVMCFGTFFPASHDMNSCYARVHRVESVCADGVCAVDGR